MAEKPTAVKPPMDPTAGKTPKAPKVTPAPGPAATGKANANDGDVTPPKPGGANDTPPKEEKKEGKGRKPAGRPTDLEKKLLEFFQGISMALALVNANDAIIIEENAEALAHAYAKLAKENAAFKRILDRLLEGSAWSEAVMVTLMTAVPIAANHGLSMPQMRIPGMTQNANPENIRVATA